LPLSLVEGLTMADLTGKTVGRYRITELIGQGPTAAVYKAYQVDLDRYVAIKVFPGRPAAEAGPFLARFEQEVRVVAVMRHPHIISLIDFGSEDGTPYVVMEYLPGTTLKARLDELAARRADLPWGEAGRIGGAVAGALAYAHQRGIAHRNVKPTNVLLTSQGNIILTDFGLAAMTRPAGDPATISAYLAPEQGRGEPGDARSDIYALGVLLYEMVTGQLPFEADTPPAMLEKRFNDPVPFPGRVKLGVPLAVEQVILKALAKNPADRYQTGADIAGDLTKAFRAGEKLWPEKPPGDTLHVDFVVRGKIVALLDRGFSLDTGQGTTAVVSTSSRGDQLGLHPGDEVSVFGGPDPQTGIFRSGTIHKILPNGEELEIKDEPQPRKRPWLKLW
jgi:serine/threonine protein kinase